MRLSGYNEYFKTLPNPFCGKMGKNYKKNFVIIAAFFLFIIAGIAYITLNKEEKIEYETPPLEKVVEQYFTSWNSKNYPDMYATMSDGFKKIEPTARNLQAFIEYANSQGIDGIQILSIKEASNDGKTASVDYNVEFLLSNGKKSKFDGTYTLKYREGDVIPGWKLIHPYGENIDTA